MHGVSLAVGCALHPLHPCSMWEKQPLATPGRRAEGASPFQRGAGRVGPAFFPLFITITHRGQGAASSSPQSHWAPHSALKSGAGTSQGNKIPPLTLQCGTERLRPGPRHQPDPGAHRCAPAWLSWHRSFLAHPALPPHEPLAVWPGLESLDVPETGWSPAGIVLPSCFPSLKMGSGSLAPVSQLRPWNHFSSKAAFLLGCENALPAALPRAPAG